MKHNIITSIRFVFLLVISLLFIFVLPRLVVGMLHSKNISKSVDSIQEKDVIVVFGAVVTDSKITPLQEERLHAALILFKAGKGKKIVLSNTDSAVQVMKNYVLSKGINEYDIEIDSTAETTLDTCKYEKQTSLSRSRIFVTQGFHLPRALYQCNKIGVSGSGFVAESIKLSKPNYSMFLTLRIRMFRYLRECWLIWSSFLGFYN